LACGIRNLESFGHLALRLLLHYLGKCRSHNLAIDNNEFILGSACVSSENYWDHKIIENLLLCLYFKTVLVSRQTEIIHQQRVGRLSHAVTERAVGKWCSRRTFWAHAEMKMMWCNTYDVFSDNNCQLRLSLFS